MKLPAHLFLTTGQSALLVSTGYAFPFVAISMGLTYLNNKLAGVLFVTVWLASLGLAIWWMLHRLRPIYSKREARAAAIAFLLFKPVSLGLALVLSELLGGYGESLVGHPWGGLAVAFVGLVAITAFLDFMVCWTALAIVNLTVSVEGLP